jgi:peptide/nickel transport system permease protein
MKNDSLSDSIGNNQKIVFSNSRRRVLKLRGLPFFPIGIVLLFIVLAIGAPFFASYHPNEQNLLIAQAPPSADHLMGTDHLGRDVLSRVIYGGRISLLVGIFSVTISCCIGVFLGIISVFLPNFWGEAIMRLAEIFLSLPAVLIALAVASTVGSSLINVILIIGLLYWAQFARLVRGEALSVRERDYVIAARAVGCSTLRIIAYYVLPNVANTIIVMATLQIAAAILLESILSFLGVGVPLPTATWGSMVAEGRSYIGISWWIVTFPGFAVMLLVLSVNLLGDWLRDRFDPKLRQ